MRIISQDREFDTPYEKVLLYVLERSEKYHIFVSFGFDETYDYSIGAYNTKERCLEIMQEIREAAAGVIFFQNELSKEDIVELRKVLNNSSLIATNSGNVSYTPYETYFYMPEE